MSGLTEDDEGTEHRAEDALDRRKRFVELERFLLSDFLEQLFADALSVDPVFLDVMESSIIDPSKRTMQRTESAINKMVQLLSDICTQESVLIGIRHNPRDLVGSLVQGFVVGHWQRNGALVTLSIIHDGQSEGERQDGRYR